ncbi:hypothetical protein U5O48_004190 [Cronobacter turicensis]|nr:hypothetical protein [Cronobacter turicensis]
MIKFKYSLTLYLEDKCWIIPIIFALSVASMVDSFNEFYFSQPVIYYLINGTALLLGWCAGAFVCTKLMRWVRENTIWASEWDKHYSKHN